MLRNCPIGKVISRVNKVPGSSLSGSAPKGASSSSGTSQNHLYALTTAQESEASPDVVTGMLKLFSHDMYNLLDLKSTLSFVTPFAIVYFGFGLEYVLDLFFSFYLDR